MYYLIGRDLDADGRYEFIQDMDNMILTENANRALQVTENELDYIDMPYLNAAGFYAMEADRFQVSLLEALLFHPAVRGYRPRVAPPPRRRTVRRRMPTALGLLGALLHPHKPSPRRKPAPRPPKPPRPKRAAPARPKAAAPARPAPGRSAGPARPAAPGRRVSPARPDPSAVRRPLTIGKRPGGRGGRGPGR